jgi:hypothetical protein
MGSDIESTSGEDRGGERGLGSTDRRVEEQPFMQL